MNKKGILLSISVVFIFSIFLIFSLIFVQDLRAEKEDIGKAAYKKMKEAEEIEDEGNVKEAVKKYQKAAELYEKALKESPDNDTYQNNYHHCLGRAGYVQLSKAKELFEMEKFKEAAGYFESAIKAYEYGLEKIPDDSNYLQNLEYCLYYKGKAAFTYAVNTNGKAPDFSVQTINNKELHSDSLKGKVTLLEFWTSWCPHCQKTFPILQDLYDRFSSQEFQIVALSMDKTERWKKSGSAEKAEEMAKEVPFQVGWGTKDIYYDYGVFSSVPTIIILDKNTNIFSVVPSDDHTEEKLSSLIQQLLK
jgi:thiol-disulfide isomerase/thioredoxin